MDRILCDVACPSSDRVIQGELDSLQLVCVLLLSLAEIVSLVIEQKVLSKVCEKFIYQH